MQFRYSQTFNWNSSLYVTYVEIYFSQLYKFFFAGLPLIEIPYVAKIWDLQSSLMNSQSKFNFKRRKFNFLFYDWGKNICPSKNVLESKSRFLFFRRLEIWMIHYFKHWLIILAFRSNLKFSFDPKFYVKQTKELSLKTSFW